LLEPAATVAFRRSSPRLLVLAALLAGCSTMRGVGALGDLDVELDRVTAVKIAGMPLDHVKSGDDVSLDLLGKVGYATLLGNTILEADVVVRATNPPSSAVAAELLRMDWTLLLDGRDAVSGTVDRRYTIRPGQTAKVPVHVAVDLSDVLGRQATTLLRLGMALAGTGDSPVDVSLQVVPVLGTPLGGLALPVPITIPIESVGS
jgi:hypothetical protein